MTLTTDTAKTVVVASIIFFVLTTLVIFQYRSALSTNGAIVIPAGNTYLGKRPTPATTDTTKTIHGRIFAYSFEFPANIALTTFPNDPYDIYAIDCCDISPSNNVLIGVDTLKKNINEPKRTYVQNWWKQFGALKGVTSIEEFTNSAGLKGYKAKYFNSEGASPNLDVFFEVPNKPEYVIHLASGTLEPDVFAKIVDSVGWAK